jgi:hypothetical protein
MPGLACANLYYLQEVLMEKGTHWWSQSLRRTVIITRVKGNIVLFKLIGSRDPKPATYRLSLQMFVSHYEPAQGPKEKAS